MARAVGKEPIEEWGLPADGWLRMNYRHYKFRDLEHWRYYEQRYIDMYWTPIINARNALKPREKTAYEMFITGPIGEEGWEGGEDED